MTLSRRNEAARRARRPSREATPISPESECGRRKRIGILTFRYISVNYLNGFCAEPRQAIRRSGGDRIRAGGRGASTGGRGRKAPGHAPTTASRPTRPGAHRDRRRVPRRAQGPWPGCAPRLDRRGTPADPGPRSRAWAPRDAWRLPRHTRLSYASAERRECPAYAGVIRGIPDGSQNRQTQQVTDSVIRRHPGRFPGRLAPDSGNAAAGPRVPLALLTALSESGVAARPAEARARPLRAVGGGGGPGTPGGAGRGVRSACRRGGGDVRRRRPGPAGARPRPRAPCPATPVARGRAAARDGTNGPTESIAYIFESSKSATFNL